jgi:UDP-glucose 4-epimerase
MRVLLTGGCGYIGSHTCVALLEAGHEVVVVDNLCNSDRPVLDQIHAITGKTPAFVEGDIRDASLLRDVLRQFKCEVVMHFAGLKAVGESAQKPLEYYANNVYGSMQLFSAMLQAGVSKCVFSSSATVYGEPQFLPYTESHPLKPTNTYGETKRVVEDMLQSVVQAHPSWSAVLLRYFNPVGAHSSGLIGENPQGVPNNLMPYVAQVAVGRREKLVVMGNDYPTPDGTGVRDYIHVMDLAQAHVAALNVVSKQQGCFPVNVGCGQGHSVLEVVKAFEKASGKQVPYEVGPRRAGDLATYYANPSYAHVLLDWKATRGLDEMCEDTWRWQQKYPYGFKKTAGAS